MRPASYDRSLKGRNLKPEIAPNRQLRRVDLPFAFEQATKIFGVAYGGGMPLYAILVREYFGSRIMGTVFGAVAMASTLGMALGPVAGEWLFDTWGSYFWLYIGSAGIGLGAVAIALLFRPPSTPEVTLQGSAMPHVA